MKITKIRLAEQDLKIIWLYSYVQWDELWILIHIYKNMSADIR